MTFVGYSILPLYDYVCSSCDHKINNVQQSIKDKPLQKCPDCGKRKLERVIYGGDIFVRGEAKTIGQLADRNSKKMGKYERQAKDKQHNMKQEMSEKRKLNRKINSMTPEQKRKWIADGK